MYKNIIQKGEQNLKRKARRGKKMCQGNVFIFAPVVFHCRQTHLKCIYKSQLKALKNWPL